MEVRPGTVHRAPPPAKTAKADEASLRDYFAALAMQGAVAGLCARAFDNKGGTVNILPDPAETSALAFRFADAMLAARAQ